MSLGYDGKLYILAFDHRGSFKKKMFGISGRDETPEETLALQDAKRLVWEGAMAALEAGAPGDAVGVLVDEEMGTAVAREAKDRGVILAMPVEKSGVDVFEFEYGDDFGAHIEAFDPDFAKVLVRWNSDDHPGDKAAQGERLKRLSDWLHDHDRKFLFELLVPASPRQLALVGGDTAAYDSEVRPFLTLEAIDEIQQAGIEPDIWKIEGLDRRVDCELLAGLIRRDGRDGVVAVVLGRGADDAKVGHWLEQGATVDGYRGFAIGRTIWWDGVEGHKNGTMSRDQAVAQIAHNFRHFIDVYERAGR
jgi:myo-inositol catabolism protein IolC